MAITQDIYANNAMHFPELYPVVNECIYSEIAKGTGGTTWDTAFSVITGQLALAVYEAGLIKINKIKHSAKIAEQSNFVAKIQDEITKTFGLSMKELAEACHLGSTKTLYNWRSEEKEITRRTKGMNRLFLLSQSARNWRNFDYINPKQFLNTPVLNGKSLFDLLTADSINNEEIQFLGSRLSLIHQKYELSDPFA